MHSNCLSREARAELVWQQGKLLAIRSEMGCSVALYHLGGFFVEVWYSPEDNQIALVHGFEGSRLLKPYLEVIDLEGLMEKALTLTLCHTMPTHRLCSDTATC